MARRVGIDVGGTNLRVGVFDDLSLLEEKRIQADFSMICHQHSPEVAWTEILTITSNAIQHVLTQYPDVEHIGIGFPGFIDPVSQTIAQSPNLPGLKDVNLSHDLADLLNKKVVVENDANAAAFGEYCLAGEPETGLIYLGLGTGVGGGLILNGKPYVGHHGYAMEVGHITVEEGGRICGCGNLGCMEQYASASGVSQSYFLSTQNRRNAAEIADLAKSGIKEAVEAYDLAANALAQATASIVKVVDVPYVVIGGGMAGAWGLMDAPFQQRLHQDLIPVLRDKITVKVSTAEDVAGMLGAAMLASII